MKSIYFFLFASFLFSTTCVLAQPDDNPMLRGLSKQERALALQVPDCLTIQRENIIVLIPRTMIGTYVPESGVTNHEELADWLERAYGFMREWTFYDPNARWERSRGERTRLTFAWNNKRHFIMSGRPYIGVRDAPGSANWFGYISHEMAHDFIHVHPDFSGRVTGWIEGLCDYMRYHMLLASGMTKAAQDWEKALYRAKLSQQYQGKARRVLDFERKNGLGGPAGLWRFLKGKDINALMNGVDLQPIEALDDLEGALVAAWDFEGTQSLADKASAGQVRDDLEKVGTVSIENGIATITANSGGALKAANSVDLAQVDELTLWARFRLKDGSKTITSLIDKRRFKKPEARSYALLLLPNRTIDSWSVGGQVSGDGTQEIDIKLTGGPPSIPTGEWREVAMVVRRVKHFLSISWLATTSESLTDKEFVVVNGPSSRASLRNIFASEQPLFIGNNINVKNNPATLEFDEVRIYNRALGEEDLASIVPGELSAHVVE